MTPAQIEAICESTVPGWGWTAIPCQLAVLVQGTAPDGSEVRRYVLATDSPERISGQAKDARACWLARAIREELPPEVEEMANG